MTSRVEHDSNKGEAYQIPVKRKDPTDFIGNKYLANGKPVYNNVREVYIHPSEQRDSSASEYYAFLAICQENTRYKSLTNNCDTIAESDLAPGDLYIGYDKSGKTGFVYVLMNMFINDQGNKIYAFATGCPFACDFHMPLVNEDRNDPWLTVEQITSLAPAAEHTGFYRLRIK